MLNCATATETSTHAAGCRLPLCLILQHVLPKGFRRARNYGFLHPNRKSLIALLYIVLKIAPRTPPTVTKHTREFGGFKRDLKTLVAWLLELRVELVLLESTGFTKSVFAHLEAAGIPAWVVNAHHVKHVPGRKTDVADSEWLAQLGRFGLVRGSFIPPRICANCASSRATERSFLGYWPARRTGCTSSWTMPASSSAAWFRTSTGVCQTNDRRADRRPLPDQLAVLGIGRLKGKREALAASLDGDLSPRHRLVIPKPCGTTSVTWKPNWPNWTPNRWASR